MDVIALTERLAILLETVGADAVVRDFNKISKSSSSVGSSASGMATKFGLSSAALAGGAAAAGVAIAGFAVGAISNYQKMAMEVVNFQRASGASATASSQLVAAMDDVGISAATGGKAIFQLGKRLKSSADDLAEFGVHAARGADGNTDLAGTLLNVSDAFTRTTDPAKRAQLLTAAFGRTGLDLVPILEKGRSGIEGLFAEAKKHGQILTPQQSADAKAFGEAIDDLQDTLTEFSMAIGKVALPAVTKLVGGLTSAAEATGGFLGGVRKHLDDFIPAWLRLDDNLFPEHMDDTAEATETLGDKVHGLSSVVQDINARMVEEGETLKTLKGDLFDVTSAQQAYKQAQQGVVTATQKQAEAQQRLRDLLADGQLATRAAADATRDLEKANDDVARAQRRVADLQRDLDDLFSGKAAAAAQATAADDLAKANLRVRRANTSLTTAQERLNTTEADGESTALDLENAHIDLEQATLDLKDANKEAAAANDKMTESLRAMNELSQPVIDKRAELKTATLELGDAQDKATTATDNYGKKLAELAASNAGDPNFNEAVRKAREDVAAATQDVAGATQTASQRAFELRGKSDELSVALAGGGGAARTLRGDLVAIAKDPAVAGFLQPAINQLDLFTRKAGVAFSAPVAAPSGSALGGGMVGAAFGTPGGALGGGFAGAAAGGSQAFITINALDPKAAGDAVVAALRLWEQRNGPIPIRTN